MAATAALDRPATGAAVDATLAWARRHRERFVRELQALVRFPSVSAHPARARDVRACAQWLAGHLRAIGLHEVDVVSTARHPVVRGAWRGAPGSPTALVYGHYDVVPAEPLAEWRTPPFGAAVRGDHLYGRGASDDKGQLFAHVKAVEAWLATTGALPVDVVFLLDGEEEIGSPSLPALLDRERRAFAADVAVVSDMPMLGIGRPALTYGMRGAVGLDVRVSAARRELHSGTFGGAVPNPAQALCEIVASLHDASGRLAVAGFYDRVRPASAAERARLARGGPSAEWRREVGTDTAGSGEPGYSAFERATLRPALIVQRLAAGYTGPGPKPVIPSHAAATLTVRLVPDQDPDEIAALLDAHLRRHVPVSLHVVVDRQFTAPPFLLDREPPGLAAAVRAYGAGFGTPPRFVRSGGTIPALPMLRDALGLRPLLMGFALPGDGMHGPNERLHLPTLWSAIDTSIHLLAALGR